MRNIKKISVLIISIMISILLTACEIPLPKIQKSFNPEESMKVYIDVSCMKDNDDVIDFIGSESEKNVLYVSSKIRIKNMLLDQATQSEMNISDNQIDKIYEAALRAIDKVEFKIEKVSEDDDKAQVKISYNYLDLTNMESDLYKYMEEEVKNRTIQNKDDAVDLAVDGLIKIYEEAKISDKVYEETYEMHREGRVWIINDEDKFEKSMGNIVLVNE